PLTVFTVVLVSCTAPPQLSTTPLAPTIRIFVLFASVAPVLYTLSLHDALPIFVELSVPAKVTGAPTCVPSRVVVAKLVLNTPPADRKSIRLNSSHVESSYADSCPLKASTPALPPPLLSIVPASVNVPPPTSEIV